MFQLFWVTLMGGSASDLDNQRPDLASPLPNGSRLARRVQATLELCKEPWQIEVPQGAQYVLMFEHQFMQLGFACVARLPVIPQTEGISGKAPRR